MAQPIQFQGVNLTLAPPEGFEREVAPLPVRRTPDGHNVSCWILDAEELAAIARTGKVWVSIWAGFRHPPVAVAATREALP